MNLKNALITAIRAIMKNKMRSSLTSIGIIIGVSSVIIMVGMGNSARIAVREKVFSFGSRAMEVRSGKRLFQETDLKNLKKFPEIEYISPIFATYGIGARYKNLSMTSELYGVNNDYLKIKEKQVIKGRTFTKNDMVTTAKVAIIGSTVKNKFFKGKKIIGEHIIIKETPFKIIGILEDTGIELTGRDFDKVVLIPYTTARIRIWKLNGMTQMYVSADSEKNIDIAYNIVKRYLRRRDNTPPGEKNEFRIRTSEEKLKMANDISGMLSILLAGIASISLFVGGVGIMNIMLVSVTERTREIGIRMAIGAKKRDIMNQFLIESVMLSTGGGVIGILLGLSGYYLILYFIDWPFLFSIWSILISVGFASGIGIFFGYYPSRKASNLKPIDALKFE